jgi:outer membrane protein OmpA-like peptidoglycan-associated protein
MKSDDINNFLERFQERIRFWFKQGDNEGAESRRKAIEQIARVTFIPFVILVCGVAFVYSKIGGQIGSHREVPQKLASRLHSNSPQSISTPSAPDISHNTTTVQKAADVRLVHTPEVVQDESIDRPEPRDEKRDENVDSPGLTEGSDLDAHTGNAEEESSDPVDVSDVDSPDPETASVEPSEESGQDAIAPAEETGGSEVPVEVGPEPVAVEPENSGIPAQPEKTTSPMNFPASFKIGSAEFHITSDEAFNELVMNLKLCTSKVFIIGHSDNTGTHELNYQIGLRRAHDVKAFLQDRGFVTANFEVLSRGDQEPVADNSTNEGRASNRRVVLVCE